ncbi:hypothetical protein HPB49_009367 [Dermacentor silvarum]|uniref:Uncharacterized protein n=1 Tax=Dermacentor silvarum TaxID=543639 RepID=A0ACB8DXZ2_DERSI|nr:hypothetical protein HPB49_009367 [Dermacentor silvarum]
MAAENEEGCLSKERATWTYEETCALTNILEDVLPDLRGAKRNLKVYMTIAERIRAVGVRKSIKEVKKKAECGQQVQLFNGMVHGGVGELQELRTDSRLPEASLASCEAQASLLESAASIVPAAPTTTAAEKKRLAAPAKLLAQLLDEQRQLRYSMERHKSEHLAMQRKRLEIMKRSEIRADKLWISCPRCTKINK